MRSESQGLASKLAALRASHPRFSELLTRGADKFEERRAEEVINTSAIMFEAYVESLVDAAKETGAGDPEVEAAGIWIRMVGTIHALRTIIEMFDTWDGAGSLAVRAADAVTNSPEVVLPYPLFSPTFVGGSSEKN